MTTNPLLLSTAVEAVMKAGEIQMRFIESGFEVSHKGTIDLVTEADVAAVRDGLRAQAGQPGGNRPDHVGGDHGLGADALSGHAPGPRVGEDAGAGGGEGLQPPRQQRRDHP